MDNRIHIKSVPGPKGGKAVAVVDADTGERIDVPRIAVIVEQDDVVIAEVTEGREIKRYYVEGIDVVISNRPVKKHIQTFTGDISVDDTVTMVVRDSNGNTVPNHVVLDNDTSIG